jgi:sugar lactone lactonase YvrE
VRPSDLAVDETHVYWINDTPDPLEGGVFRIAKQGGAREQVVTPEAWRDPRFETQPQGATLLLDATDAFVVVNNQNNIDAEGALVKVPKAGGSAVILARDRHAPLAAALDESHLYWARNQANRGLDTDGDVPGSVMRILKDGGEPEVLAQGQNGPQGIVLDEEHVYWVNWVSGNIRRTRK